MPLAQVMISSPPPSSSYKGFHENNDDEFIELRFIWPCEHSSRSLDLVFALYADDRLKRECARSLGGEPGGHEDLTSIPGEKGRGRGR